MNVNDPTRDHVRRWMEKRGYDFPVLWSDGYNRGAGVRAYPTTLVVDREGQVAFFVVGNTDRFAQEYGWRIEALLEG
jgi:hypothetical protein